MVTDILKDLSLSVKRVARVNRIFERRDEALAIDSRLEDLKGTLGFWIVHDVTRRWKYGRRTVGTESKGQSAQKGCRSM